MRRIRVLYPFVGGPVLGGSHISALSLAASLDPSRFEARVLVHFEPGAIGKRARDLGLDYEVLEDTPLMSSPGLPLPGRVGALGYMTRTLPALRRTLKQIDPDIVHTNEGRMHANWIVPSKLSGCRHLWHHRQDPAARGANTLAPLLADHIVSVSHYAMPSRPIRSLGERSSVIRSPFDFPAVRPDRTAAHAALCEELGVPGDAVLLGYFGSIIKRKRPDGFVRAVDAVRRALPDRQVHGLLFGDAVDATQGLDETCRELVSSLGLADNFHFMGFRSPVFEAMSGVDVMLVPAVNEPFGRTLIESMYLGTPVVATRHGGNIEAIADGLTGFLVEPDVPESFVDPVSNLISDPALQTRIADAAQADAAAKYGAERHVSEISRLYEQLFEGPQVAGTAYA
ncbi:glycosyltransferase family 4 protein [Stappia sp. BW2]|uniref:glycosyltransferase family 4 protein n=1 Tax=Stappia sp. BW2 TaxID=2592622 RepID=UPI0011DEEE99|nr:glycosyltransferase family 4 protein [Stappia sp. BW2]TYC75957.1 glycosyltransferase family 4 protein [Stappia sp. BW2]